MPENELINKNILTLTRKIREEIHTKTQRHGEAFKQRLRVSVSPCEFFLYPEPLREVFWR